MTDFPILPQNETKEHITVDFNKSMNMQDHHAQLTNELREKWTAAGEINPARQRFFLTAEAYVVDYRQLAKETFPHRFNQSIPEANVHSGSLKAPPLIEGFGFSDSFSRNLVTHSELHQIFNPVEKASLPHPPPPPLATPPLPPAEDMDVTATETLHRHPQSDADGSEEGAASATGGGQQ